MQPLFMKTALSATKQTVKWLENHNEPTSAQNLLLAYLVVNEKLINNYYDSELVQGFICKLVNCLEKQASYQEAKMLYKEFLNFDTAYTNRHTLRPVNNQACFTYA